MHGPEILVPLGFFAMITTTAIGVPLAKALARKWEGDRTGHLSSGSDARLERMEQAIESIALEVERVAEGQRFTTRLLSERTGILRPSAGDSIARMG